MWEIEWFWEILFSCFYFDLNIVVNDISFMEDKYKRKEEILLNFDY